MSFFYSILPISTIYYREETALFCYSIYPYPLVYIIERQQCRSVTQFYPYPLCYIIERQQCRSVTQFFPYPLSYIIERQ